MILLYYVVYSNGRVWKTNRASNDFHFFFFKINAPPGRSSYNTMNNMGDTLHAVYYSFIHNNIIIIIWTRLRVIAHIIFVSVIHAHMCMKKKMYLLVFNDNTIITTTHRKTGSPNNRLAANISHAVKCL
jgi:hypothetical protein